MGFETLSNRLVPAPCVVVFVKGFCEACASGPDSGLDTLSKRLPPVGAVEFLVGLNCGLLLNPFNEPNACDDGEVSGDVDIID